MTESHKTQKHMYTYNGLLDRDRQTLALMNCFLAGIRMNRPECALSMNNSRPKMDDPAMKLSDANNNVVAASSFVSAHRSRTSSELRFSTSRFDADQQLILAAEQHFA